MPCVFADLDAVITYFLTRLRNLIKLQIDECIAQTGDFITTVNVMLHWSPSETWISPIGDLICTRDKSAMKGFSASFFSEQEKSQLQKELRVTILKIKTVHKRSFLHLVKFLRMRKSEWKEDFRKRTVDTFLFHQGKEHLLVLSKPE